MKILLVDDDVSSVMALTNLLRYENSLKIASNGLDALDFYLSGDYDVIITDLKMPKMNGLELLKAVRMKDKKARVIMVTGYPTPEDELEAKKNGAYAFMTKPMDVNQFMDILQKIKTEVPVNKVINK